MAENQAKFEESIKQLQGDKSNVKEVNSLELLNAEDQKHKEQVKELKEAHRQVINEKEQKIQSLELRIKSLQEQYEIMNRE